MKFKGTVEELKRERLLKTFTVKVLSQTTSDRCEIISTDKNLINLELGDVVEISLSVSREAKEY